MAETKVTAELSDDDHRWLLRFTKEAGINRSDVMRAALGYYRASTGPEVTLLERRLSQLEKLVGRLKYGWHGEIEERLEALEKRIASATRS